MLRFVRFAAFVVAMCAAICLLTSAAQAGTILKLGLGSDAPPDIEFDGTTLSTVDDGNAGTTGDQDTNVDFQDFLSSFPDILTSTASISLNGLTTAGPATVFAGVLVIQNFTGGTFDLYDPANGLLLSGALTSSALTGPIGPPATGALFTTSLSSVAGGSLAPFILPDSLSLSMSFTDINGGAGFSIGGATAPLLNPFTADTTLNIAAEEIPEPATAVLAIFAAVLLAFRVHRDLVVARCGR